MTAIDAGRVDTPGITRKRCELSRTEEQVNVNPYQAPASASTAESVRPAQTPMAWRTTGSVAAVAVAAVFNFAMEATLVAGAARTAGAWTFLPGVLFLALFGAMAVAAVFLGMWVHRAASNLRGLGRSGMRFSPTVAVLVFYIPLVNLALPAWVMSEATSRVLLKLGWRRLCDYAALLEPSTVLGSSCWS